MSKWILKKLGDIADVKLSNVDKKINENEREVRLCNYTDVYKNAFINSDKAKGFMVASCNESEYEKFRLKKGQVAITKDSETRDDIGVPTYIAEDFEDVVLGYHLSLLTPIESKLDGRFLHYWLNSKQAKTYFENNAGGSGQRCTLTLDIIKSISINLPTLPLQKAIASILSDLDTKIELNNKINAELEAMAKTLYDYWFVQFDFPNEKGKPYKSSGGTMVYNEELKREIPIGWKSELLNEWIAENKSGDWGKETIEGNYTERVNCIRGADINGLNGTGELKTPQRFILKNNTHKLLNSGDIIIEMSGGSPTQSTGRIAYIIDETLQRFDTSLICSNFCKALTLKNKKYLFNFVYQWNNLYDAGVLFGYEGKTSGLKNLLYDSFVNSYYVSTPPEKIVNEFYKIIEQIQTKRQKNLLENKQLSELRDWLLPMLMNGQVTVSNVMQSKPIQSIVALNNTQLIPIITKRIKDKLGIGYGEVGIQKTVFNIYAVKGVDMNYKFINHNNGTYSSALKDDLKNNPYLADDKSKGVFYIKKDKEAEIDKLIGQEENKIFVDAVDSVLEIYKKEIINKETYRIELFNTTLKLISDLQTLEFAKIYEGFKNWKIKNDPKHKTKAERFKQSTTKKMLEFIIDNKLHLNQLK